MNTAIYEKPSPRPVPAPARDGATSAQADDDKEADALIDTVLQRYHRSVLEADTACVRALQGVAHLPDVERVEATKRIRGVCDAARHQALRAGRYALRGGQGRHSNNAAYRLRHPGKKGYTRGEARVDTDDVIERLGCVKNAMRERRKTSAFTFGEEVYSQIAAVLTQTRVLRDLLTIPPAAPDAAEGER